MFWQELLSSWRLQLLEEYKSACHNVCSSDTLCSQIFYLFKLQPFHKLRAFFFFFFWDVCVGHWSHFNHSGFRTHGLRRRHLSSRGSGLCCVVLLNHPPSSAIDAFSGCFHTLNWLWWGALLFIVSECIYDSLAAVKKKAKKSPPLMGNSSLCAFFWPPTSLPQSLLAHLSRHCITWFIAAQSTSLSSSMQHTQECLLQWY